jgi:hypothetical protein
MGLPVLPQKTLPVPMDGATATPFSNQLFLTFQPFRVPGAG